MIPTLEESLPVEVRPQTVAKAVARIGDSWRLSNLQVAELMGMSLATWNRFKAGNGGRLSKDQMLRASLLAGIFKGLRLTFNGPLTYGWPTRANSNAIFQGRAPVDVMIEDGIPAMMRVRQYVDAVRGGL